MKKMFDKIPTTGTLGQDFLPFEMGYLPDIFQKKAAAELNETPENITENLNQLKKLLKEDKLSKSLIFYDEFLIQFLRVRKHNVEKAFHQLKSYVILRRKNPNMFLDLKFDILVQTIEDQSLSILPWRCPDGCTILLIELDNWDPETFPIEEVKRALVTYLLSALQDPMTQVNGFKVIFDVKSNPVKHLRYCTPNNLHLIYHGCQNVCPARYTQVHIINDSLVFRTVWTIIKQFLSEKLRSRVIFHKDSSTLLKYFSPTILPKKFGGDLENYDMTEWLKRSLTPEKVATIGGTRNWLPEK